MKTVLSRAEHDAVFDTMSQLREIFEIRLNQREYIEAIEVDGVINVAHFTFSEDVLIDFSVYDQIREECKTCPVTFFTLDSYAELQGYMVEQMQIAFATF